MFDRSSLGNSKIRQAVLPDRGRTFAILPLVEIHIPVLGIAGIKRNKEHRSEMKFVKSMTATVTNHGDVAQKLSISEFSETFETSTSITTTKTSHRSHEVSVGSTISITMDGIYVQVEASISLSYTQNWGESEGKSHTVTNTTTKTVTHLHREAHVQGSISEWLLFH